MTRIKNAYPVVAGQCPMGCGETLFLGEGGHVTCSRTDCPSPVAVDSLLSVPPEADHVVVFADDNTFTIQHPLRERIGGDLFNCPAQGYLSSLGGPPVSPGRYRVVSHPVTSGWAFEEITDMENDRG